MTNQTGTYKDTYTYDASKAVDGNISTNFYHGSCSHTSRADGGNASWHVFLDGTFLISQITIYLRNDTLGIRNYHTMDVLVNGNMCQHLPENHIRDGDSLRANPVKVSCIKPVEGNNVTIIMAGPYLVLCEVQVFESCHCSNGCLNFPQVPCSKPQTGNICKSPWFGRYCQMENIAFQKPTRQSSTYTDPSSHCAAYAVDGNSDTDITKHKCSHTNEANTLNVKASWQVLLDDNQMFNIKRIRIYLRSDLPERNKEMTILVDSSPCTTVADFYRTDGSLGNPLNITCTRVMEGRNVTIIMDGPFLTLCEVQVFVCSDGWFEDDCNKQCQCLNTSEVCDKNTGYCESGCATGKQGQGCQQVCSDGWFGSDCDKKCQCLSTSEVCDKNTGYCESGCATGKQRQGCQQDCDQRHYGVNCSSTCGQCLAPSDCRKDNGTCTQGCQHSYHPPLCQVCSNGSFGSHCDKQCQCQSSSEVCDKDTGYCKSGCAAGKQGQGCQQDCGSQKNGFNCTLSCGHCEGTLECSKNNGTCKQGCKKGYKPPLCEDCEAGIYGRNCTQQCGFCKEGTHCNRTDGICEQGCLPHFQTPDCKICSDGWFGNCNNTVKCVCRNTSEICDKGTGICKSGCRAGKRGIGCQDVCKGGLFGTDCSKHCKCRNRTEICDKVTGNCRSGCPAGIRGSGCQEECADYTYGINCSGVCSCLNQCEVCDKVTGECQTGYHTTTVEKSTAIPLKNENIGHKTDVRFIVVCCLMVVLGVYSAAATTLVFRLKRKNATTQAELEKQYMSLETRGESSVYDVIDGTHTYSNDVQPENSVYENPNNHVMKRDEHSL